MRKRIMKNVACWAVALLASAAMSMTVTVTETNENAVKETEVFGLEVVTTDTKVETGTLGNNDGFTYTYDVGTKTVTITGEDSGLSIWNVAEEAEKIIIRDCKPIGSVSGLFANREVLTEIEFDNFDTSQVTDMHNMFWGCSSLTSLDVSHFNTSQVTDMWGMFGACSSLTNLDVSNFDTSQVVVMAQMFEACTSLTSLDLSGFDTSQVTNMACMFMECERLTDLNISNFNTSQVTSMSLMFMGCEKLTSLDVSKFNTSQVTEMSCMFLDCKELGSLEVDNFDTSQVVGMACMFMNCEALTDLDISNFDTTQVTDMSAMFMNCQEITNLDVSVFITGQVTDMSEMFKGCSNLESLDLSSFDTSQVTNVVDMFTGCYVLECIQTPEMMAEGQSIALPAIYCDSEGNITDVLTLEFCNDILTKSGRAILMHSSKETPELTIGENLQIALTIDDEAQDVSTNSDFTWSVDSVDVVTVSERGLVTGIGMGTAKITCVNKENSYETATIEITIKVPFTDLKTTDWQYPYVVYAYENNLMSGKGEGKFDMNGKLTRSEFVTVLYSYIGKPATTYEQNFSDVAEANWFATAVTWAKQNNVTAGNPDGSFGVYNNITREQLVVMLYQFAKNVGVASDEVTGDLTAYEDVDAVSIWATKALTWAVQNNIISGKNRDGVNYLDPKGNTTRGECATMMMRYVELAK